MLDTITIDMYVHKRKKYTKNGVCICVSALMKSRIEIYESK